jgi:uncharacterized C2H2 Zn-finger protein
MWPITLPPATATHFPVGSSKNIPRAVFHRVTPMTPEVFGIINRCILRQQRCSAARWHSRRMPRFIWSARGCVHLTSNHEEQIAKTIEILDRCCRDPRIRLRGQRNDPTLSPTADRAGHVNRSCCWRTGRQDEAVERRKRRIDRVNFPLDDLDMPEADAILGRVGSGQLGAHVEKLALDPPQEPVDTGWQRQAPYNTEVTVEFINRPKSLDASIVLANPRTAEEPGFSSVARFCVDLHALSFVASRLPFPGAAPPASCTSERGDYTVAEISRFLQTLSR